MLMEYCYYSDINGMATDFVWNLDSQVEKLDKNAISEVKAYQKPPKQVETVLSAVMILFGQATDWSTSKRVREYMTRRHGSNYQHQCA